MYRSRDASGTISSLPMFEFGTFARSEAARVDIYRVVGSIQPN
jgi:hypothetical protein